MLDTEYEMNQQLINMLLEHIRRHPHLEVVDIYKLLYQSANGPAHLLASGIDFEQLKQQWQDAQNFDEPPFERISVDGRLVRAHFAPLREMGASFDNIQNALMLTAQSFQMQPRLLVDWWHDIGDLIEIGVLPLSKLQYEILDDEFQQWGFVPKHHSKRFAREYKPAYIVSLVEIYETISESI